MSMGNYFSVLLFLEHSNDTVPETIVTVKSYGSLTMTISGDYT